MQIKIQTKKENAKRERKKQRRIERRKRQIIKKLKAENKEFNPDEIEVNLSKNSIDGDDHDREEYENDYEELIEEMHQMEGDIEMIEEMHRERDKKYKKVM